MKLLIDKDTVNATSPTFAIPKGGQVTVYAMGLEADQRVEFELVLSTDLPKGECECPPLKVIPLGVAATAPLMCCNGRITLTAARPYVVLDAPQLIPLRARVLEGKGGVPILQGQKVWLNDTNTPNPTDYMRGCACS